MNATSLKPTARTANMQRSNAKLSLKINTIELIQYVKTKKIKTTNRVLHMRQPD